MNNNLVRDVMYAAGFYQKGKKDEELKQNFYDKTTILLGGKSYDLASIAWWDGNVFADELDNVLSRLNPIIHDIYAKNALTIFNAIRMANVNSKQGFKGQMASGNELNLTLLMARQFYNPDSSTNKRSSWVRTISSTGAKYFLEGTTSGAELTMGEEEAMVWLALYNPALDPCIDAFQITMNTQPYDIQALDFDQVQEEMGDPLIELREPWTLPPEQSAYTQTYYWQTGTDETRPIGVWIKMSRNLRALATP